MPKLFKHDAAVPEQVRGTLKKYDSGQNLIAIVELPGWQEVLTILRSDIESDERKVLEYRDSDSTELFGLLRALQAKKDQLEHLERTVRSRVALAQNPPEELQRYLIF